MLSPAAIAIAVSNAIPLFGVLFFGWSLFSVMFIYWAENIAVGVFNLLRMYQAENPGKKLEYAMPFGSGFTNSRWALMPFFAVHYGIFMLVHGAFVFQLFGPPDIKILGVAFAVFSLFLSHGVSHLTNFIGKEERKRVTVVQLFSQPYKRMAALHVSIILGGWFIMLLGAPGLTLIPMIVLKTGFDVVAHNQEHAKFSRTPAISVKNHE